MIGSGALHMAIQQMIADHDLSDSVSLLGAVPPAEVRRYMEKSNIFLFTSDKHEGWGAVLNESMNSGCVVIADDAIGSVPFVIRDGINGYTYHKGNVEELYSKLLPIMKDLNLRKGISLNAYQTMTENWNAKVAAERFISLSNALLKGKTLSYFNDGPLSKI